MATNRERLNKMTNEELAKFLKSCDFICNTCAYRYQECLLSDCYEGILKWLEQESEEQ